MQLVFGAVSVIRVFAIAKPGALNLVSVTTDRIVPMSKGAQMLDRNSHERPADSGGSFSGEPKIVSSDIVASGIAMLSDEELKKMSRSEIIDAVQAAKDVPQSPVKPERIFGLDIDHLRHVLYLVRRWMRNKINEQTKRRGRTPFFKEQT